MKGFLRSKLVLTLLVLFMMASAVAIPLTTSVGNSHAAAHSHVIAAPTPPKRQIVTPLSPPNPCTQANDGQKWNDPATGEQWECICFTKLENGGQRVLVCAWALVLAQPNPSTWVNLNSGLYMDVNGGSKNDGAQILQWPYTGANSQWWNMGLSNWGNATLKAENKNSSKCMGVNNASTTEGASIIQWACNGNADQAWTWAWTGSYTSSGWPIWNVVDLHSNMCLGITNGSTQSGAYALQWACNGNADQEWY